MSDLHTDINMQGLASITTQNARNDKLKIRIPKRMWNDFKPSPPARNPNFTKLAIKTRSKLKSGRRAAGKDCGRDVELSPTSPKGCKVKLWRFQYGGPKHVVKGALQNEVTLESPCLRVTCANCWKWHPHLIAYPEAPDDPFKRQSTWRPFSKSESISPEIYPRILDDTWKFDQNRRASTESITSLALPEITASTPKLTPVKFSFPSCDVFPENFSSPYEKIYENSFRFCPGVFPPTSLTSEAMSTASMEYLRHLAHRRPRTTCLVFSSQAGKNKYSDLVRRRERKLKKQAYDRAYRARMKLRKQ